MQFVPRSRQIILSLLILQYNASNLPGNMSVSETLRMQPDQPLVSVITPTFNRGYILGTAIESVLAQTYPNFEHLIIDDGSTDNTVQLVAGFEQKDPRVHLLKLPNMGPSAARNVGLEAAMGQWVVYIDSDNELLPPYITTMINELANNPGATYALPMGHRTLELYENGSLVKLVDDSHDSPNSLNVKDIFMRKLHFDCNGFMHSRKFIDEGVRWDQDMRTMEDWDFGMMVAEADPDGFLYVPKTLFNYHQRFGGDGGVSNTPYLGWARAFEAIYQKHKGHNLMKGQSWYPERVQKYKKMQKDYEAGLIPPPHLRYFQ